MPADRPIASPSTEALLLAPAPPARIETGMVLAAGRGTRLGRLTETLPKPLIELAGRTLLDAALDDLVQAGVSRAVVNAHHLADAVEERLVRRPPPPQVTVSREDELLETGGGVLRALPLLGEAPFFVVNADVAWGGSLPASLRRLAAHWREPAMDALLLVMPTIRAEGYDGPGDFDLDSIGRARRRREGHVSAFVFTGAQILSPRAFESFAEGRFPLVDVYDRAAERDRLFALVHEGPWIDVGTPARLARARDRLGQRQGAFL